LNFFADFTPMFYL